MCCFHHWRGAVSLEESRRSRSQLVLGSFNLCCSHVGVCQYNNPLSLVKIKPNFHCTLLKGITLIQRDCDEVLFKVCRTCLPFVHVPLMKRKHHLFLKRLTIRVTVRGVKVQMQNIFMGIKIIEILTILMSVFYTRGLPKLENGYFYRLYFDMQIDDM